MDVKHFKLIAAVAKTGSLTKAAQLLCLTPSALSHQLRDIEARINTKIFTRSNNSLVLTHAGKALLQSSNIILDEIKKVTDELNATQSGTTGMVRMTTECSTCYHWLPTILKTYQKEFPKIDVRLNTSGTPSPLELLLSSAIDVAVVYRRSNHKTIGYIDLFADDVVALVPTGHPLESRKYLIAKDFANETYITHSQHIEQSIFYETFLKPKNVKPKNVLHIHLTETVLDMVKEGLGITVMARWLVAPCIDQSKIKMIALNPHGLKRKWFIATTIKNAQSKYMSQFITHLRDGIRCSLTQ
jgi:LysR family transcriptional regulator for metE and metH